MRTRLGLVTLVTAGALAMASASAFSAGPVGDYDPLSLTCTGPSGTEFVTIAIKAGPSGAPAGFSLQWMTRAAWEANGNAWYDSDDPRLCKQSFSGQPSFSGAVGSTRWELGPNQEIVLRIGGIIYDETGSSGDLSTGGNPDCQLKCGEAYVFRAFAHASRYSGRSCFSFIGTGASGSPASCASGPSSASNNGNPAGANLIEPGDNCSTSNDCANGCTFTQGFWKTHGSGACHSGNNDDVWCVSSLTLGTVSYTKDQLCSILNTTAGGNGYLSLAHQLIAAKLNAACSGATCAADEIAAADILIGSKVIPPVGTATVKASVTSALTMTLDSFNNGLGCADHCPRPMSGANRAKAGKTATWGTVKTIYR